MTVKELPPGERPRERLIEKGADALAANELLAVLLGSGTKGNSVMQLSQEILSEFGGLKAVSEATLEELQKIKGLGQAKAIQLKAALTLGKRAYGNRYRSRYKIQTPSHAYNYVKDDFLGEKREHLVVILLDIKGYVIKKHVVSIGILSNTLIHPREVFYPAIRHQSASLVLVHNHPSGDPTPSKEDLSVTESLIEAGKLMGIPIQDHIIIGDKGFVSLREVGIFL